MIDAQSAGVLQDIVRRESRSLLMYMGDAFPWTTSHGETTRNALLAIVKAQGDAIAALGRYLVRQRITPPPLSSYPSHFTTHNFVGLDYLLRMLVEAQQSSIRAFESDLSKVREADAKAQVQKLLDLERRHLRDLEALLAAQPEPGNPLREDIPVGPDDMSRRLSQIQTRWSLVFKAHEDQADARMRAQAALMHRYHNAIYRYILAAVRDPNKADNIAGEFALRLVRGSFKNANPEKGRFRDFIKTAVSHLITDLQREGPGPGPLPPEIGGTESGDFPSDKEFLDRWRQELLDRAWDGLAQLEQEAGQPFYTLLRYRAENPDVRAAQMGAILKDQLGKELNEAAVRKALQRARERFADLLLEEVARSLQSSLQSSTVEALKQEFLDLDLLAYCRSALDRFRRKEGPAD